MGRKTWDSIPLKFRPLTKRMNVILTNQQNLEDTNDENGLIQVYNDFERALESLSNDPRVNEIFVIGGATVYDLAINKFSDFCKLIIKTRINKEFDVDTFMPKVDEEGTYSKLYISQTYSHQDVTFDYCFLGNKKLLSYKPELIPTRLFSKYPKHPEM